MNVHDCSFLDLGLSYKAGLLFRSIEYKKRRKVMRFLPRALKLESNELWGRRIRDGKRPGWAPLGPDSWSSDVS